jgi:NAD(P)-dependent dehydrogenase (short-subunit alcohol dehydrogenase family)
MSIALDTLLDRTIAPGYGKPGLLVRRRLPDWPADPPRMDGATVVVTGAASGLGLASAIGFARLGPTVHAIARDERRAGEAVAQIVAAVSSADARPASCDVSSLRAIRAFAETFSARVDVLVNNAGVMPSKRSRSAEGHELMFATHVLAPIALLSALLERSTVGRVINVSSGGMYAQSLPVTDWESELSSYGPKKLYARTKREEVVITLCLAERLRPRGVVVHSMHPGWADTEGVRRWMPLFRAPTAPILRTPEEGADTIVWLGASPEAAESSGLFWHDRRPRPTHYRLGPGPESVADREALWRYCQAALAAAGITTL